MVLIAETAPLGLGSCFDGMIQELSDDVAPESTYESAIGQHFRPLSGALVRDVAQHHQNQFMDPTPRTN
jgi:hypothetical protein